MTEHTTKTHTFKIEKLTRDLIPSFLENKGINVSIKNLSNNQLTAHLKAKLVEESQEVAEEKNEAELTEEIADVLEVIDAICASEGLSMNNIKQVQAEKRAKKGGFKAGIYIREAHVPEGHPDLCLYKEYQKHHM